MDKKVNPYGNTSNEVLAKRLRLFEKRQEFLNEVIKNIKHRIAINELIELAQFTAFNEGREQGRYEASQALKELLNVENPGFDEQ